MIIRIRSKARQKLGTVQISSAVQLNCPGGLEAHSAGEEAHPVHQKAQGGGGGEVMEAQSRSAESFPEEVETPTGAGEAHLGALETHLGTVE